MNLKKGVGIDFTKKVQKEASFWHSLVYKSLIPIQGSFWYSLVYKSLIPTLGIN